MRLNKNHKDIILDKVIKIKFPITKLEELKKDIGLQIRSEMQNDIIDGWEKYDKHIEKRSSINVSYRVNSIYEYLSLNVKSFPYNGVSTSYKHKSYSSASNKLLSNKASKMLDKIIKYCIDKEDFELSLKGALSSITTDKQLKEHLPKLVKYLPLDKQCGLVPITTFENINKQLKGL